MVLVHALLSALGAAALLFTVFQGWNIGGSPAAVGEHLLTGMGVTIYVAFVHTMYMTWLMGLGKSQKTAVLEHGLDPGFLAEMRRIKARGFPMATFAPMLLIAAGLLGGGVKAGTVAPGWHTVFVAISVLANLWAIPGQLRVLRENDGLMRRVEQAVEEARERREAESAKPD